MISSNISTSEYKPLKIDANIIIKILILLWNVILIIYNAYYNSYIIPYYIVVIMSIVSNLGVIVPNNRIKQLI